MTNPLPPVSDPSWVWTAIGTLASACGIAFLWTMGRMDSRIDQVRDHADEGDHRLEERILAQRMEFAQAMERVTTSTRRDIKDLERTIERSRLQVNSNYARLERRLLNAIAGNRMRDVEPEPEPEPDPEPEAEPSPEDG